jgi:chaperonin GroEL (HSP60 family)
VFGGELLTLAEHLLRMGLAPPDIIAGYELGRDHALKALDGKDLYNTFQGTDAN